MTHRTARTAVSAAAADTVWRLVGLRVAADEGWCRYLAGDPAHDTHLVELDRGVRRLLVTGEGGYWAKGIADAHGWGDLVWALAGPTPQLLTPVAAGRLIPALGDRRGRSHLTSHGIEFLMRRGDLYPVYALGVRGRPWYVFADQVAALAATRGAPDPDAARRWARVEAMLPPLVALEPFTPVPSPDPLPIPFAESPTGRERRRRDRGLMLAQSYGWVIYEPEGDAYLVRAVALDGCAGPARTVPVEGVLPYLLGAADARGQATLVAYRSGLG